MSTDPNSDVDLLILGAGWTSQFLIPMLREKGITFAATTRNGRDGTIEFKFDPESDHVGPFKLLPRAKTVVITFPLNGKGTSGRLVGLYRATHGHGVEKGPNWIQLGSTGIWSDVSGNTRASRRSGEALVAEKKDQADDVPPPAYTRTRVWSDRKTPFDGTGSRVMAEEELRTFHDGAALNLAGLWGGERKIHNWVSRKYPDKDSMRKLPASLHMIHGRDVSQAIIAVHLDFTPGERWLLTDGNVYDWWQLARGWGEDGKGGGEQAVWVRELMEEMDVKALPRPAEQLGRALDSRDFWTRFGLTPLVPWVFVSA